MNEFATPSTIIPWTSTEYDERQRNTVSKGVTKRVVNE